MKCLRVLLVAACSASLGPIPAGAVFCSPTLGSVWTWGDRTPPCDTTLQACIDQASSCDVVQIDTNDLIQESISIDKSLTLKAQTGFAPVLDHSIVATTPVSGDTSFTIEGLTLAAGGIDLIQQSAGSLRAVVVDNAIQSGLGGGISVTAHSPTGPISFQILRNDVTVAVTEGDGISVDELDGNPSFATGVVSGNQIVMGGSGASKGGILLHGVGGVDVIANRIAYEGPSGDAYGISLTSAAATPTVRILDNLVTRASQSFGAAGIAVSDMSGAMSLEIANNTVDSCGYGISLGIEGATAGSVANNIITSSSSAGLGITNSGSGTVSNHHNLFFENQFDVIGSKAGAASIFGDPHYAGPGDYHLQSGSPARDAGDDGSVPVDLTTDLDGNPRVQGSHVDLGAYETAAEPSVGIAAPASLSALAALALRRRR